MVEGDLRVARYFNDATSGSDLCGDRLGQCGRHEGEHAQPKDSHTYQPLNSHDRPQPLDARRI